MRSLPRLAALILLSSLMQSVFAQAGENLYPGTPISTTVYVSFTNNSMAFHPTSDNAITLDSAKDAALVAIRGRTSTKTPTAKDEALALARAISARAYLIARGVSPLKITINYASAADFIADNSTSAGQLENQRVEIDVIHISTF